MQWLDNTKTWIRNTWEEVKSFFKYSETIFLARFTALTGLITAVIGQVDWSPVFNLMGIDTGFSWKQTTWLGIGIFFKGVIDEIARRRNANL
jgi:hypothetical protein